jgi:hypothetical protein
MGNEIFQSRVNDWFNVRLDPLVDIFLYYLSYFFHFSGTKSACSCIDKFADNFSVQL